MQDKHKISEEKIQEITTVNAQLQQEKDESESLLEQEKKVTQSLQDQINEFDKLQPDSEQVDEIDNVESMVSDEDADDYCSDEEVEDVVEHESEDFSFEEEDDVSFEKQEMPKYNPFLQGKKYNQYSTLREGLSFEDYYQSNLQGASDIQALVRADDVLLQYCHYKHDNMFTPVLKRDGISYKPEHQKLSGWFSTLFFQKLQERIAIINPKVTEENYFKDLEQEFGDFWGFINSVLLYFENQGSYVGIANINPVMLFLKKILRIIQEETYDDREINFANYVDESEKMFTAGSGLFLLELFSQLREKELISLLQQTVASYDRKKSWELVDQPIVLLCPWPHQRDGLTAWVDSGMNGILEMATATGKTLIGLMAIELLAKQQRSFQVRIFAHSKAILNQWRREVIEKLGLIYDPHEDYTNRVSSGNCEICFNTVQSVINHPDLFSTDLLIVDEVHHVAAPEFRRALQVDARWKMGLSAYIDKGMQRSILSRELGDVVYQFSIQDARKQGVIPEFDWLLHTVYLDVEEESEFRGISDQISHLFNHIRFNVDTIKKINPGKDYIEDLYEFIQLLKQAKYRGIDVPDKWQGLQGLLQKRRWIIHRSHPKLEKAIRLAQEYACYKKVIMYTMDIESCELIAKQLRKTIDDVFVIHSNIEGKVEKQLSGFKDVRCGVLIGARMLDEGIDLPNAEIGINVSSSKTRLQLVQRMGRILRKGSEGKKPVFHHYIALPEPESYVEHEDNLSLLDDLSWAQETALKMGVDAEVANDDEYFEKVQRQAEEMIHDQYHEQQRSYLPGYGTFKIRTVLNLFSPKVKNDIISQLKEFDEDHRLTDVEWIDIIRLACTKEKVEDEELKVSEEDVRFFDKPGYWWLLVLGNRKPKRLVEIFEEGIEHDGDAL